MAATETGSPTEVTDEVTVTAHESSPGKTVFTESGNTDGWIATDFVVELRR